MRGCSLSLDGEMIVKDGAVLPREMQAA